MEAAILKQTFKPKIIKLNVCLKNIYTHMYLTNVIFVYYVNNHFMELFYEYYTFILNYWEKSISTVS